MDSVLIVRLQVTCSESFPLSLHKHYMKPHRFRSLSLLSWPIQISLVPRIR